MRVLITNDDGIDAPGIAVAAELAREVGGAETEIWVVAPESDHSGAGHGLTYTSVIRVHQLGNRRFAVRGTPTDCVILGLGALMAENPPDVVLSGVNYGHNVAEDTTVSGTVGGATEAALREVPGLALSQSYGSGTGRGDPWASVREHGADVIRRLLAVATNPRSCFNVNFPARSRGETRGMRVAPVGKRPASAMVPVAADSPRTVGRYYWLTYQATAPAADPNSDQRLLAEGWITITPLTTDMTARSQLNDTLKSALQGPS